ncbi:MAG: TauD/TfdA family dioxygenase [Gammaproteobacteria bacterium]|nr:TauD/TfdA family dioxygenase [Gammaproteobacteria bacterium]MYF09839.1 TauD/TfdA family dioxygenase [Gammaproteobacteria bacterium]MYF50736.1 TauD/TfdA family dioxygenase [Gammaproteobacteria bacterium]
MMQVTAQTPGFAADVTGINVAKLCEGEFAALYQAWLDFGVLRLRGQRLSDDELQAFSARFGPLEEIPLGRMPAAQRAKIGNRYVTSISNILVDGKPIGGLGNAEAQWHSDMTYTENPPPASILLGIEIPETGGDTFFANQYAALDALPKRLRDRIEGLTIKHDAAHTSVGQLRPGFDPFDDPRDAPGAIHPIIRTHEESGRSALYLGRRDWACIPGLPLAESEALLDELWAFAARDENVWRQQWQPYDLIIWDNRCVLHRRDAFDQSTRRLMRRCQVLSDT